MAMEKTLINDMAQHCLHLCSSANMEDAIFSHIMEADAFVTANTESWKEAFKKRRISCPIKKPALVKQNEKIIVDGPSLGRDFKKWEKKWGKQPSVVCVYNIDKIETPLLKELVMAHDKMIFTASRISMLSHKNWKEEIDALNPDVVEGMVKKELKNIIISLLLSKPMCGTELVKLLYEKFRVFVSPGMLYPVLHELEKKTLLKYEYKLKNKIYSIREKEQVKNLLKSQVKANSLLSQILVAD